MEFVCVLSDWNRKKTQRQLSSSSTMKQKKRATTTNGVHNCRTFERHTSINPNKYALFACLPTS